ncbi:MAG TPA: hypothetical protein VFG14_20500 [Chthoniobacteraceae bacterium]|nr:hypothetical protein [Chthoniobacteraceae bacterium]
MRFLLAVTVCVAFALSLTMRGDATERPLMTELMGVNGHTVQFKPELYAPVAKLVRDYHPVNWDLGKDTSAATSFPFAANRVDWSKVYGSWLPHGWRINACLIFDEIAPADWKDPLKDGAAYGEAFARYFGPGGKALVESVEIGNEPGKYSDEEYARLFKSMAEGVRRGDPNLKIATCAANLGPSGRYSKSVDSLKGLEDLYDVVNIHLYAEIEGWPTWRRSYPEDSAIKFREHLRSVLSWRNEHAPRKELWLTEFGWDASTKPAPTKGTFAKWEGSSETQQAQWIVRAWLMFAREGVDRAYLYFFNDDDEPQVHGSSGLTRKFVPKPSFHASAWLQKSLGEYRFKRVVSEDSDRAWIYDFSHESDPKKRVYAVWKPSGPSQQTTISVERAAIVRASRMPLSKEEVTMPALLPDKDGNITLEVGEAPLLLWLDWDHFGPRDER